MRTLNPISAEWLAYGVAARSRVFFNGSTRGSLDQTFEALGAEELVRQIVEHLEANDGKRVLERTIARSAHDKFAFDLLQAVENNRAQHQPYSADIVEGLPSFITAFCDRMNRRYRVESSACVQELATSDWTAFVRWIHNSPNDQAASHKFWTHFIDQSPKRLAQAIHFIYPIGVWESDPKSEIGRFVSIPEIEALLGSLSSDNDLDDIEREAINRMKKLLAGEYPRSSTNFKKANGPRATYADG